jgi:hypothetical protein
MLRILDSLIDKQFETTEAGEVIYHPHGVFGRGYRVPSDHLPRVRKVARSLMLLTVAGIALFLLIPRVIDYPEAIRSFGWLMPYGGLAVLLGVIQWLAWRAVSGLESVQPPPWPERLHRDLQTTPAWVFWVSIACGLWFGVISLAAILGAGYENQRTFNIVAGVLLLPLSAALIWYGALGVSARRRQRSPK